MPASPPSGAGASRRSSTRPTSLPTPAIPWPARSATRSPVPTPWSGSSSTRSTTPWTRASRARPTGPPDQVTYLRPVLDEARRAGRPVILTADHGHVLDRGEGAPLVSARSPPAIARAPRDRARSPCAARVSSAAGEKSSPQSTRRSTTPPGRPATTAARPWPRSSSRSITLLPSDSLLPAGWYAYDAAGHAPAWWDAPAVPRRTSWPRRRPPTRPSRRPPRRRRAAAASPTANALFDVAEAAPTARQQARPSVTLGGQVVASPRMASQRQAIPPSPGRGRRRRADRRARSGGGRLTLAEAAAVTGQPAVRMSRYLAQVARLLNVDGYAVLNHSEADRLVELNLPLLRQQFLGE